MVFLEERAERLLDLQPRTRLQGMLQEEIRTTLEHVREEKEFWQYLHYRLLVAEVYVDEELLRHESRTGFGMWIPERMPLLGRLAQIDAERRQLHSKHHERRQGLELRLLDAVQRAEHLP